MDSCPFYMLHYSRDQNVISVTNGIYLDFLTHHVFVNKDRMILGDLIDDSYEFIYLFIIKGNSHSLSAKYIGRTYKNGISQIVRGTDSFFRGIYRMSCRSLDTGGCKHLVKKFSVLSLIYIFGTCSENPDSHRP